MNRKKANDNLIGEAIRRNRLHAKMTAKDLGLKVGFSEATAETRIGQYECGVRIPSPGTAEALAKILGISKYALLPTDISTDEGMFFAIMRIMSVYDVRICKLGENFCLSFPNTNNKAAHYFTFLYNANKLYREGKITADDYMFVMDGVDIHKGTKYMEGVASLKRTTPRIIDTDFYELLSVLIPDNESFFVNALSKLKDILLKVDEEKQNHYKSLTAALLEKMRAEHENWLEGIKQMSPDRIVSFSSQIAVREEIIYSIESNDFLTLEQVQSLLEMKRPLAACMTAWKNNRSEDENGTFYEDIIKKCANSV